MHVFGLVDRPFKLQRTIVIAAGTVASVVCLGAATSAFAAPADSKAAKPAKPAASAPAPKASFEDLLAEAEPVSDLAHLVEPLFPSCDESNALEFRQCEGARSFLERESRAKTFVAYGDSASVSVSPYDAAMKSVDIDVQGCLACVRPVKMSDAKGAPIVRFVTTKVPKAIKGGKAVGVDVATAQLPMATPELEARWKKNEKRVVPRLRTQYIFKLGPTWSSGTFSGVNFVPLAYRIVDACSGEVLETSPASASAPKKITAPVALQAGDVMSCPPPGEDISAEDKAAREELARLPARLSREMIEQGMSDVQTRVHDCHVEFEESGTVNLRLVIDGPSGRAREVQILPPFDKTPAGLCVRAALKGASFEKTRTSGQEIKIPVYLR